MNVSRIAMLLLSVGLICRQLVGKDIGLADNHTMLAEMKTYGVQATAYESPGFHAWNIWRDHLNRFAPLLYKAAS